MAISKKRKIYNKTNGHCYYCGKILKPGELNIDHIFPKKLGGCRDFENLVPVCRRCNSAKGIKTLEEYRLYLCKKSLREDPLAMPFFSESQINWLEKWYGIKIELPLPKFYFEEVTNGSAKNV